MRKVSKTTKRTTRRKGRETTTFPAIDAVFDWKNDEWALAFLPTVRLATLTVKRDDKALEQVYREMIEADKDGEVERLLEGFLDVAEHLDGIVDLLTCAMERSSIVLKRLGWKGHGGSGMPMPSTDA